MVAGVGSAPTSADFQPAAHLSEPSSVLKWSLGVVTFHGLRLSTGCSAVELLRVHENGGAPENRTLDAFAGRSGFRDRFLVYAGRAPLKLNSKLIFTGGNKENEALKAWHLCCLRHLLFQ